MRFNIFGLHEKIYKFIAYGIAIISTIFCIYYYFSLKNKNETFVISIFYALLLFVIGIYINNMQNKIQNLFYRRKEQYLIYKKLLGLFLTSKVSSNNDDDLESFILFHQVFTGRTSSWDNQEPAYIAQNGFQYKNRFIALENKFIEEQSAILEKFNKKIKEYINNNKLEKKFPHPHIFKIAEFINNPDQWCKESLILTDTQKSEFLQYIQDLKIEMKESIVSIKKDANKLRKNHLKYRRKIQSNICKIEKIYGDRLSIEINNNINNSIYNYFTELEKLIKSVDREMATNEDISDLQKNIASIIEAIQEANSKLDDLSDKIDNV